MFQRLLASSLLLALVSTVAPACTVAPAGPTVTVDSATSSGADATGETVADTVPDAGATVDVSDAIGGPYSCATACANFAKFNCPAKPAGADCVEGCSDAFSELPPGCAAEGQTFLQCLSTAPLFCSASGEIDVSNCKNESVAFMKCAQGFVPPAGNCASITCIPNGPGGGGCACFTTCGSSNIEFKCNVTSCKCKVNGATTLELPADGECNNPSAALLNLCLSSPPPP